MNVNLRAVWALKLTFDRTFFAVDAGLKCLSPKPTAKGATLSNTSLPQDEPYGEALELQSDFKLHFKLLLW